MAINRDKPSTTTKPASQAVPPVTFTPEELQRVIAKATAEAVAQATASLKAEMQQALAAKPSATNGGSNRSQENEKRTIAAFRRAGFGLVTPHQDVFTFRKWLERGFRPVEGSKSLKIGNLRLFCRKQVRELTKVERAASAEQPKAETKRSAKVVPITTEAHPQ
jgi:hypothetical protein